MEYKEEYQRFNLFERIQHIILMVTVTLCALTGLPLLFAHNPLSNIIVSIFGGITISKFIHQTSGISLILLGLVHMIYYIFIDRKIPFYKREIIFNKDDWKNFLHHMKYIFNKSDTFPKMGRYTWYEKLEYFAVFWGTIVMAVSGISMMFKGIVLNIIPLSWLQTLWSIHGLEATLAILSIIIMHMYHVHLNPEHFPMSKTWIDGKISKEEMKTYHPLELEKISKE